MKFSIEWLKDFLDTQASVAQIAAALNRIGHEVEGIEDPADKLAGFRVAHVLTAARHPDADKLQVLTVDTGDGDPLQVVCGAPNARAGMKGVLGLPGAVVPKVFLFGFFLSQSRYSGRFLTPSVEDTTKQVVVAPVIPMGVMSASRLKPGFLRVTVRATVVALVPYMMTEPSVGAFFRVSMAIAPLAPARFSTSTLRPVRSRNLSAK